MSESVFRELAALTRVVAGSKQLDRILTGADVPASAKRALLVDVTKNAFSAESLDAAVAAVDATDSTAAAALLTATINQAFNAADLESIETALYSIGAFIDDNANLRQSISNFAVSDNDKAVLLRELLADKTNAIAVELVCTFVYVDHGRGIGRKAIDVAELAAERRNAVIADVRTAVEIDDSRRRSLIEALQASLGRSVQAQFSVDPSIIGSVVVRVGDELIDGSVRQRLEQARKAVAS